MHPKAGRLFLVSCLALITSAFSFQIRQNVADDMAVHFGLTKELVGSLMGGQFLGMALAMLVFSPLCDPLGMGRVLFLAFVGHCTGILGTMFAGELQTQGLAQSVATGLSGFSGTMKSGLGFSLMPDAGGEHVGFWILWAAAFLIGSGNGLLEIAINPLAATLYPDQKTHKLNVLHAWWPGGLIVAGVTCLLLIDPLYGKPAAFFQYTLDPAKYGLADFVAKVPVWQCKYALVLIPMVLYGLLGLAQSFPATERVAANVSTGEMFLQIIRPMFLVWAFCMLLTASTELATNAWMESIVTRTANVSGTAVFVYITVLMFVLRFFAGPLAHAISPVGILFVCSILTAVGLYWLSAVSTPIMAFAAATVFGIGITYYWPTMLGVTAERFPKGGALALGLMGCVGNLAISQTTPMLGAIYDSYSAYALPEQYLGEKVSTEGSKLPVLDKDGKSLAEIPLVKSEDLPKWVPPTVAEKIYPAGGKKIDPIARPLINPKIGPDGEKLPDSDLLTAVKTAEVEGARWAFRWTTVLPAVLVLIFGLIALVDHLRGGYKAVRI